MIVKAAYNKKSKVYIHLLMHTIPQQHVSPLIQTCVYVCVFFYISSVFLSILWTGQPDCNGGPVHEAVRRSGGNHQKIPRRQACQRRGFSKPSAVLGKDLLFNFLSLDNNMLFSLYTSIHRYMGVGGCCSFRSLITYPISESGFEIENLWLCILMCDACCCFVLDSVLFFFFLFFRRRREKKRRPRRKQQKRRKTSICLLDTFCGFFPMLVVLVVYIS